MIWLLLGIYTVLFGMLLANACYLRRRGRVAPEQLPFVSVLIPARNERDNLERMLPGLLRQEYSAFEVIVYDDASEDGTWALLEATRAEAGKRMRVVRGSGPPPGWVGKVHALYQAARRASGDLYLFLDADAALADDQALRRLVERHAALPAPAALSGFTRLCGGGKLLVSLVPLAILTLLPWPLVRRFRSESLGALNGQCWMLEADLYERLRPHEHVKGEVLEDVQIGRYLKRRGVTPYNVDVTREVSVYMYRNLCDAWRGFRKNVYLIMGGRPAPALVLFAGFALTFTLAPLVSLWLLVPIYLLKGLVDRRAGFPVWVSLLAPVSFLLASALQLDSILAHWLGRVRWKGRRVGG